jgi:hypothetical protein
MQQIASRVGVGGGLDAGVGDAAVDPLSGPGGEEENAVFQIVKRLAVHKGCSFPIAF